MDLEKDLPIQKTGDNMEEEGQLSFSAKLELLKAQILIKNDDFVQSSDILARILTEKFNDPSYADILEDICANFFNSVTLLTWVHYSKSQPGNPLSKKREEAFTVALNYCINQSSKITIREVYLNLLITLAVLSMSENPYFEGEEINFKFEKILQLFYEKLDQHDDNDMQEDDLNLDEADVSDVVKDKVVANILEAIFMTKRKKVRLENEKLDLATSALEELDNKNVVLKASIVSYVLYMQMGLDGQKTYFDLGNKIDELLKELKNSEIGKQLQTIVEQNLKFNKAVTLFLRGKMRCCYS